MAQHAIVAAGGNYLISPPARSYLGGEKVLRPSCRLDSIGHIVCEGVFGLSVMSKTGLQHLVSYTETIDKKIINTQARRHPDCLFQSVFVLETGNKPVGSIGSKVI